MASALTDYERAVLNSLFFIGSNPGRVSQPITYPIAKDQRSHLAYYGAPRSGKTSAIEYALQQLARAPRRAGVCYIDPHGDSYWRMASFLRQHHITDRVLFWDINDPEYVVSYDPFEPNQSFASIAGNLTSALLATLGREADAHQQPHLKTTTEAGLLALLRLNLPFALARDLFDPQDTAIKKAIAARLDRSTMLGAIAELPRLLDRYHELAAPYRRLENLFQDDRLRLTFTTAGLNFRQLMDEGWIVLVNTQPKDQADEAATLFTRLLVKHLFLTAKQREKGGAQKPFFLIIDEASRYLTTDTAQILAQTAGYGLYLLLGMQSVEQARHENEETYIAIRACMNAEVVMRLADFDESIYFARRFYGHYLDLDAVQDEHTQTVAIPRSVPHVTVSRQSQRAHTSAHSYGSSTVETHPDRLAALFSPPGFPGVTTADGSTLSEVETATEVEGETETPGWHTEFEYQPVTTKQFYTPDQLERLAARRFAVRPEGAGQRFGIVRINETEPMDIEIPSLPPAMYSRAEMTEWLRTFKSTQPATLPLIEAQQRFDVMLSEHVHLLTNNDTIDHEPPTQQSQRGNSPDLNLATPRRRGGFTAKKSPPRTRREEKPT